MSDYDNTREDEYEQLMDESTAKRDAAIEFHAENWMNAVTKSPEKSHATFPVVKDYSQLIRTFRPATSVDVLVAEINNADFLERTAQILIDIKNGMGVHSELINNLFDDMAASYAENEYESNIKE